MSHCTCLRMVSNGRSSDDAIPLIELHRCTCDGGAIRPSEFTQSDAQRRASVSTTAPACRFDRTSRDNASSDPAPYATRARTDCQLGTLGLRTLLMSLPFCRAKKIAKRRHALSMLTPPFAPGKPRQKFFSVVTHFGTARSGNFG